MKYTITGDTIEISDAVRSYIEKRFAGFERFMDAETDHEIVFTISKTTAHQREDSIRVEVSFRKHTQDFFATGEASDIMGAIDNAKEELMREVTQGKAKRNTLFHCGARKIKKLLRIGS